MGRVPEAVELARDYVVSGYDIDNILDYNRLDPDFDDPRWDEFEDKIPEYEALARQREKANMISSACAWSFRSGYS
jgi:hypothetical protein